MSKRKRFSPEHQHELVELNRRPKSSSRKIDLKVGITPALLTGRCGGCCPLRMAELDF